MTMILALGTAIPLHAQEAPASPLDIAPPRDVAPIARPIKLVREPRKPRLIVVEQTKSEVEKAVWHLAGPANSRAADAIIDKTATIDAVAAEAPKPAKTEPTPAPQQSAEARAFCANLVDPVREARAARQEARLAELEAGLTQRIEALEAKKAELRLLIDQQKEAEKRADDGLVAILSRMRPEAAAAQLAAAEESQAAALLTRLNPRNASAILNEIEPAKAAKLAEAMARGRRLAQGAPQ